MCHGVGFVHPTLPDGTPDFSQVIPCRCVQKELEKERLARLQRYSNLGPLARLTFDHIIPQGRCGDPINQKRFERAYQAALSFAREPQGWLVLEGTSGCGKTHLAAAIVNHRLEYGFPAFFVIVPDLLDHLRSTFSPSSDISYDSLFEQVKNAPLLVLDDLGAHSSTPWAEEKLYQIINHRFNTQLPTVITTNIPVDEVGEKLRTRLTDPELCHRYLVEESETSVGSRQNVLELELLRQMTFNNFDSNRLDLPPEQRQNLEKALHMARKFAQSPKGWLVFLGTNGCGKTHLAAAIANYRQQKNEPVYFIIVPDFLDNIRSAFASDGKSTHDKLFEEARRAPLLIMDDFDQQSATPWTREKLYQIINYRYNGRLPTVITTCLSLDEIEIRISSRMMDPHISLVFNITAPDYRTDRHTDQAPSPRPRRYRKSL